MKKDGLEKSNNIKVSDESLMENKKKNVKKESIKA